MKPVLLVVLLGSVFVALSLSACGDDDDDTDRIDTVRKGQRSVRGGPVPAGREPSPGGTGSSSPNVVGGGPSPSISELLEEALRRKEHERLMRTAAADVDDYWHGEVPNVYGVEHVTPKLYGPYTARSGEVVCAGDDATTPGNAFYCRDGSKIIAWDGDWFYQLSREFSPIAPAFVIAHEWGHAIQDRLLVEYPTNVEEELGADCLAGAWARWAAKNSSLTREDFDTALEVLFRLQDPDGFEWLDPQAHGTAFERARSFTDGVQGGPTACITPG